MLTAQTIVEYARLELARDPEFRRYCDARLSALRAAVAGLPPDLESCLAFEASPGVPLAKMLLDAYNRQASEPQWIRAKRAATAY